MIKAEELARAWMLGTRGKGSDKRPAWSHPQDVVNAITNEMPGYHTQRSTLIQIAWLHDVIEDGKLPNGDRPSVQSLFEAHIPMEVAFGVGALTYLEGGSKSRIEYLVGLGKLTEVATIVKCVDRLCNLREGVGTFKDKRWIRYVGETLLFIHPLTEKLAQDTRIWLSGELLRTIDRRPLHLVPGQLRELSLRA
jgi:(p)ppGpp synthase/HD superfamily hydrolase